MKVEYRAETYLQFLLNYAAQLLLGVFHSPFKEVCCLKIIVIKHLRQNALVMCFAERFATGRCRILYRLEVWFGRIFPAILEFLCHTTATLGEAGIAYFIVIHKRLTASGAQCLYHIRLRGIRDALIALTMVVGTNIKNGVVFAVVPANQLVIFLHKREESTFLLIAVGTFFHLRKQP